MRRALREALAGRAFQRILWAACLFLFSWPLLTLLTEGHPLSVLARLLAACLFLLACLGLLAAALSGDAPGK